MKQCPSSHQLQLQGLSEEMRTERERMGERESTGERGIKAEGYPNQRTYDNFNYLEGTTPYFFTHFPDTWGHEDLWKVFIKYGKVRDVYISRRKNKQGKRFGFVKFSDVIDSKVLEQQLDSILIGSQKLNANIPKYQKKDRKHLNQWNGLEFQIEEKDLMWLKDSYVGKTKEHESAFGVQELLNKAGWVTIKATPMGGSMVLLTGDHEGSMDEFLNQEESLLTRWFTEIKKWSSKEVNYCERRIWVTVTGIPAHGWRENVFKSLVQAIGGRYVGVDDSTRLKRRMDIGRVLLTVSSPEVVNKLQRIKINGEIYQVRILEEPFAEDFFFMDAVVGGEDVTESGVRDGGVMGLDDLQSSEGVANFGPTETGPQEDKVKRRKLGNELDVVGLDRYVEEGNNNNNKGEGQTNNPDVSCSRFEERVGQGNNNKKVEMGDKIRDEKGGDAVKKRGRKLNSVATLGPLTNLELCSKRSRAVSPARNVTRRKSTDAIPSLGRVGRRSLSRGGLGETSRAKLGRGQRAVRLRSGNSDFGLSGAYMPLPGWRCSYSVDCYGVDFAIEHSSLVSSNQNQGKVKKVPPALCEGAKKNNSSAEPSGYNSIIGQQNVFIYNTYNNQDQRAINNIGTSNGNGNGGFIGGKFDASTRNF